MNTSYSKYKPGDGVAALWRSLTRSNKFNRGAVWSIMIIGALLAFEIFNFSITQFALRDLLGDLTFTSMRWATILAITFCGIDFAGIARIFTVTLLALPYLLSPQTYLLDLIIALTTGVIIIAVFNYYISVAKDESFRERFVEMAALSLSVRVQFRDWISHSAVVGDRNLINIERDSRFENDCLFSVRAV